mgnify:FL=1
MTDTNIIRIKTKFKGILTLFLGLGVQISFAQQKTILKVSDGSVPLLGVSLVLKGSKIGTETDFDGKYSIKVSSGDILIFRYIRYFFPLYFLYCTNIFY